MQAATVGAIRQVQNLRDKRSPAYGAGRSNDWQLHIEGALGEFALAKFLDRFPSGAHEFRARDVGAWQVRTSSRDDGDLILHDRDDDAERFVLLTGRNGAYQVRGWILAADGKRAEYWRDPVGGRAAYFVPQSALLPMPAERVAA
jgi:hypothetical protein